MKVLVTGGAGYIGSHTVTSLLKHHHQVVVYDNLTTGFREAVPAAVEFVHGDVLDEALLTKTLIDKKIDAVIHFAAKLLAPESVEKPIEYYENNTVGVLTLAKACRTAKVDKIVFSSTASVYGDMGGDTPVREDGPTGPINPYGHSKLMSETILRDIERIGGPRSVVLRYFNVAGAASDLTNGQRTKNATHLIKVSLEVALGIRTHMGIFGGDYNTVDGTCVRDYIHIEDLADAHVLALDYLGKGNPGDVFNCGYGRGYTVKQVIQAVKQVTGVDFSVHVMPRRAGDPASVVADSSKIKKVLGWKPQHDSLEFICKTAFAWEKKQLS